MKLLRQVKVLEITGIKRSSLYNYIAQGFFPAPVKLGKKTTAWIESEVMDWIAARIKERNEKVRACSLQ